MTKKTPPRRKKLTTTKRKSKPKPWPTLVKLFAQLSIVFSALLLFWLIYLNALVRDGFEGRRFTIPARVYSEAQDLYVGASVRQEELVSLLDTLGYRQSNTASQAGRYSQNGSTLAVYTRGFRFWDAPEPSQRLILTFDQDGIKSMADVGGQPVLLARLDPLYIGQIFPGVAEDRVLYPLDEVPQRLILGLLLVEDDRFFEHHGVSIRGIVRALVANVSSGSAAQGGSTLTNQLVKNLYLSPDKTIVRKVNEALMSLILEFHYSKNDILETYMNEVYIGQQGSRSINGFGLGAQFYFGTTLQGLEIHQQAMLVGLIKGPSFYNPRRNPDRALSRRNLVLKVWFEQGLISEQDFNRALNAPLDTADRPGQVSYPAFMDAVRRQLTNDYRKDDLLAEGLSVFTTLDPLAQALLERSVANGTTLAERRAAMPENSLQGAAVLTRPSTGDVLAMTGDRDPRGAGFNRALDAKRPIGSLMKPAVYLAALEQGYKLSDTISDADVTVAAGDGSVWQPKNYDQKSHGQPMLIDAFAKSYNQATARLGMQIGLANVFDVIGRLGEADNVPAVPAVMLGAHEMSPFQVSQMYQTLSGNGFYSALNLIRAVSHPTMGVLQRYDLKVAKRFSVENIFLLQEAMHEATVSGTAASIQSRLPQDWWVAGKTGTTDDNRDAWFAGFTGDRQLVVWVGRDDNQPTSLTGSSGALPIWIDVMSELKPFQERRGVPFNVAYIGVNNAGVDVPDWCGNIRNIPFIAGTEPARSIGCSSDEQKPEMENPSWWRRLFG